MLMTSRKKQSFVNAAVVIVEVRLIAVNDKSICLLQLNQVQKVRNYLSVQYFNLCELLSIFKCFTFHFITKFSFVEDSRPAVESLCFY